MAQDSDYWKEKYKSGQWDYEAARNQQLIDMLQKDTGKVIESVGFGTGSTSLISGTASAHGFQKGDADLKVQGTNTYLEVTGPQKEHISPAAGLWIRPDKIENAKSKQSTHDTWLVHMIGMKGAIRAIHLDASFMKRYDAGDFDIVKPSFGGSTETFVEIPAKDPCVQNYDALVAYIKLL